MSPEERGFEAFAGRRVLVTGHTGFKGAWLSLWLKELGAEVTGIALDPPTRPSLFELANVTSVVTDVRQDIRDLDGLCRIVRKVNPEIVFHLAAQPLVRASYVEPVVTLSTNVMGTAHLLEALRGSSQVRVVVVITTDKCYENRDWPYAYREVDALGGHDPYSASKAAAELVIASYRKSFFGSGVGLASARAGNVLGGGDWAEDRLLPDLARAIRQKQSLIVRNPRSVRPWQHVLEPLHGYLKLALALMQAPATYSEAWNFGPPAGSLLPVRKLVECALSAWGEGTWTDASGDQEGAPHEARTLALAWEKAYQRLGWQPCWGFEEMVERTVSWYQKQSRGEDARLLCLSDIRHYMEALARRGRDIASGREGHAS